MFSIKRIVHLANSNRLQTNCKHVHNLKAHLLQNVISRYRHEGSIEEEDDILKSAEYDEISGQYLGVAASGHRAFVLQPYVKWGREKKMNTTPQLQLAEAEALLKTLPNWSVVDKMCVPLLNLDKKKLLGLGNLETLKEKIRGNKHITAVFVSTNLLKPVQMQELGQALGVPIYDRYAIVIQIFRAHAKSREARLQVALAEIPYMWSKLHLIQDNRGAQINVVECRKKLLQSRETKLKASLIKLKGHRELLRSKRKSFNIPSVAVVGYTNSGKTSLIKALTGDATLHPRDQLFATLDVTAHQGFLPSRLKVLFMDTIGFIQDVPSTLIEPFVATLEDAINADVILHVQDASHPDKQAQAEHVEKTLKTLIDDKRPIINVANKTDLLEQEDSPRDMVCVSAMKLTGIDLLREKLERELLKVTGRSVVRIRVESGSQAAAWLYKETAVTSVDADPENAQYLLMDVIATQGQMNMFRQFLK